MRICSQAEKVSGYLKEKQLSVEVRLLYTSNMMYWILICEFRYTYCRLDSPLLGFLIDYLRYRLSS